MERTGLQSSEVVEALDVVERLATDQTNDFDVVFLGVMHGLFTVRAEHSFLLSKNTRI